eukprot:scaffold4735_cov403-Prasinococcus_capsulatus_cf.AAC.13
MQGARRYGAGHLLTDQTPAGSEACRRGAAACGSRRTTPNGAAGMRRRPRRQHGEGGASSLTMDAGWGGRGRRVAHRPVRVSEAGPG